MFYVRSDGRLMSVGLTSGVSFDPGIPRPLFHLRDGAVSSPFLSAYDVERNGQRFLVGVSTEQLQTNPLNVIVHWSVPVRPMK
jgi:hypothetical protein